MNRRNFIQATFASIIGGFPQQSLASSTPEKKFIFIFNAGGWDPTRVFAPEFNNQSVDMEGTAEPVQLGNLNYVAHPDRPSVDSFFNTSYDELLIINGLQVRSISHDICTMLSMTGNTSGRSPGWAAILAEESNQSYALPHLVIGGPSFPGLFGAKVARSGLNGQLDALLSGEILNFVEPDDQNLKRLTQSQRHILDDYILRRSLAEQSTAHSGRKKKLHDALVLSQEAAINLQEYRYLMNFSGSTLDAKIDIAIDALRLGVSRCVTIDGPTGWDSHAGNDQTQSQLFEQLFSSLGYLRNRLSNTTGLTGSALSEETIVVVLSEMGRTPLLNATAGKDHWPYTSMLLWGSEISGNRVIGQFDEGYAGLPVDLSSGEVSQNGSLLSVESIGAALLAVGGTDPGKYILDSIPLMGITT